MNDQISIAPSMPIDKPYDLLLDGTNSAWKFALTNPAGTVTRNGGQLPLGVDAYVLALYALATALQKIPKGVTIHIRTTIYDLVQMGQRLTKPTTIPELPFLPFTPARRDAWSYVLTQLAGYTLTWQQTNGNVADLMALNQWAATTRN